MKFRSQMLLFLVLLTAVFLTACGGGEDPTPVPPTEVPPTEVPPTEVPPTEVPPTEVPPTEVPPTEVPPTAVPEPTAEPEPAFAMVPHESVDGGYTIDYPEEWFVEEMFGLSMFSSYEGAFEEMGDMSTLEGGVVIVMGGQMAEIEGDDPMDMLDQVTSDMDVEGEDMEILDGPKSVTINGSDGAQITIRGDADGAMIYGIMTVLTNGINNVVVMAVVPAGEEDMYTEPFHTMINSVIISEDVLPDPLGDIGINTPPVETIPAGELKYGESVAGLVAEGSVMSWTFEGTADSQLNVFVSPTDDALDAVIDIVDADGMSILPAGEVDESFDDESIDFTIPLDGTYRILVRGFADSGGAYTILLSEGAGNAAGGNTAGGNVIYTETIEGVVPEGETVFWEFEGVAGTTIDIVVNPTDDALDAVVDILDADGNSMIGGEVDEGFDSEHISPVFLPVDGTYSVAIRGFAAGGGPYELIYSELDSSGGAIVPPSLDEDEIGYGEQVTGEIVDAAGNSWSFYARQGDFVDVTIDPLDGYDAMVDIVDSAGNSILPDGVVDESYDTEFLRAIPIAQDGQYSIVVSGFDPSATGSYDLLLLETLLNGSGSIVTVQDEFVEAENDGHAYPFTAYADEFVTIHVDPTADLDVAIEVYNRETEELLDEVDRYTGREELVFLVEELGNYYFLVTNVDGTVGTYDLLLSGSNNVIFELISTDVVFGRVMDEAIIVYGFDGYAGETNTFILDADEHMDMAIKIEDMDDNILLETDDGIAGEVETAVYTFEEDATVFVSVSEFFGDTGNFMFSIK